MTEDAMSLDPLALRDVYDAQLRAWMPSVLPAGAAIDQDGPLVRVAGLDERGFVTYRSLAGLSGDEVDGLIARARDFFAARGEAVEWKLHGHDTPADLPERLRRAGFAPEEQETVVIGLAAPLAAPSNDPEGVTLREVTALSDLERIAAMESDVWREDRGFLARALFDELAADPAGTTVVVAEAGSRVVCAGWVRYVGGSGFATLWGGSTRPEWRRRGIYGAVVRYRARLAVERGYEYLEVDASDDSRPILQRAGFVPVTTTTPWVHTPR
jgi:ribosomal protein S18 acetylase RimI-like enzyme